MDILERCTMFCSLQAPLQRGNRKTSITQHLLYNLNIDDDFPQSTGIKVIILPIHLQIKWLLHFERLKCETTKAMSRKNSDYFFHCYCMIYFTDFVRAKISRSFWPGRLWTIFLSLGYSTFLFFWKSKLWVVSFFFFWPLTQNLYELDRMMLSPEQTSRIMVIPFSWKDFFLWWVAENFLFL